MKKSLHSRYQILLIGFFALYVVESILIFLAVLQSDNPAKLASDTHSLLILFMFVQFVYFIILFYFIPYQYNRAFREIHQLFREISEGKYQIDLDAKSYHQDEEVVALMADLQKMMGIISRFDNLKGDKIHEQHQRMQMLLDMLPQGCLILNITGEIIYVNELIRKYFPALTENLNIIETFLPEEIEAELKPLFLETFKTGSNLHNKKVTISSLATTFNVNSNVVHNRKGQPTGAIFLIVKA